MSFMKISGRRNQKGFTLVELMVVLVIIAILVAIAIPIYNKTQDNAKTQSCKANLRTMNGAVAQYQAENGGILPNSLNDLVTGGYLRSIPRCPSNGTYSLNTSDGTVTCSVTNHSL